MRNRLFYALLFLLLPTTLLAATVQLPETGQTDCWLNGGPVACSSPEVSGQDGAVKAGAAWPSPRFADNSNGTVTDNLTGLVWLKNANCYGAEVWKDALTSANTLASGNCGLTDGSLAGNWRLPNDNELESLLNRQLADSTTWLKSQGFSGVQPNAYWSASTYVEYPSNAGIVYMNVGSMGARPKNLAGFVWPVRGGEPPTGTVQLPETGQTSCYDAAGTVTPCANTGQDGAEKSGAAWPSPRFADNGNGTVTDKLTGLIWLKNANCTDTAGDVNKSSGILAWNEALAWSNALASGSCDLTDGSVAGTWRLANVKELRSLINRQQADSTTWLNSQGFSNVQSNNGYWSATTSAWRPASAWVATMDDGTLGAYDKTTNWVYVWPVRGPLSPLNDDTAFVRQVYLDFLNREPDQEGLDYWVGQLSTGARTRAEVVEQYLLSPEFGEKIAPVVRLYFAYFLRLPDYDGLMYWVNHYGQGTSLDEISDAFASSTEFQQTYGSLNNAEFVTLVYQNVLGRDPEPDGFAFWTSELDLGYRTRGQVMAGFSESEEYTLRMDHEVYVTMTYIGLLRRAPEQGGFDYWVNRMDGGDSGQILIDGFLNSAEYAARFE